MPHPERPTATDAGIYLGLMSGTSVDGIDAALVRCDGQRISLLASHAHPIPADIQARIRALSHPGDNEIEQLGALDRQLGQLFADAALALLAQAGLAPQAIRAIGSHGQTLRHRPPSAGGDPASSFTLQIGDPNTIAERTGIVTVADFRRRDMAAGGEGAPLAPAFHAAAFSDANQTRAIVNIGGIANVSLLEGRRLAGGYDTGPGNTLMDHWISRHRGESYDRGGRWAASGSVHPALLTALLAHPYLSGSGPRSTGKEAFNLAWLDGILAAFDGVPPADVMATLAELTAASIAAAIGSSGLDIDRVHTCGGGSHNEHLMQRLAAHLGTVPLASTAALGIDPDWVEAAAFGWLARQTLKHLPGNASVVTGASGERVLGAIYPA